MSLLVEVLIGLYVGLLTGIIPALVAGVLGFVFKYFTGVTLPGLGVVVLAVAIAGVNGGLLGLIDPAIQQSTSLLVALVVVMMLSLYAHSQGDKLGASLPRLFSLRTLHRQTLSADVISVVGGIGHVTITPKGEIEDVEGYPPLPPELRAEIAAERWEFPADVPLPELETRLADRLRTEYDLADAVVSIDERGEAEIAGAPPMGGLSQRVPEGHRAVSIAALVPTGIARGEQVTVAVDGDRFDGTVVSARSDPSGQAVEPVAADGVATDGGQDVEAVPTTPAAPTTTGGEGRVTVAVPRSRATELLKHDRGRVIVRSRGTRREFELLSLFRRSGKRIEKVTVQGASPLDGETVGSAAVRERYGVVVLAVRHPRETGRRNWAFSPGGDEALSAGDELFVVGTPEDLDSFREAVA